jgi:hypothetical protein
MPRGIWRGMIAAIAAGNMASALAAAPAPPISPLSALAPLDPPGTLPPSTLPLPVAETELPIRDLTPPGFATDAPATHPAYKDVPGHLSPSAPEEGGPFATAELLILRPHRGAFDFVIPGDTTGLVPSGQIRSLNFNLQPGLRTEIGHRFGGSGWEAYFGYTYFHSSAFDSVTAPAGSVLFPTLTKPGLTNTVAFAAANASFDYNVYDLMLGKRFAVDDHFAVRLTGGLRFASIRQSFSAYYDGLDARSATVFSNASFQGFGPVFGGEAVWVGWKGFHLYGRANGGLLSGLSQNPLTEFNNANNTTYAATTNNIHTVVPMASVGVGAGWQYRTVTIRMGYEITNYFNVIDQPRFVDDVGVGKLTTRPANVSLEGLFVQMGVAF